MDVRYIATTSGKLSELAIVNGQLIYLSDKDATYYDMGGNRRLVSSMKIVSALPSTSAAQEGVIYGLINSDGFVDADIWDASASTYRQMTGYVATASTLGLVKPDGTTITIDSNGTISLMPVPASSVTYDNTISGLSSTYVQGAIDEVKTISNNAVASASSAATAAANASTAAQAAYDLAAQSASVVQSYETRLSALEALADVALTIQIQSQNQSD